MKIKDAIALRNALSQAIDDAEEIGSEFIDLDSATAATLDDAAHADLQAAIDGGK